MASTKMKVPLNLELLSEKTLPQKADPRLLSYCPSMDLLALGSTDQQVLIYRLNGQRVYGASQKAGTVRVNSISWKPNGQLLATAWSDGSVRLVGAESSKTVHQFHTSAETAGITCMAWACNRTSRNSDLQGPKNALDSWEALLPNDSSLSDDRASLDLPRDLALIDIEPSLPKLSVLAAGGGSEDVFCSRSSLDALFRPFDPKDNDSVDVMVVGTREGTIHLSIYDSFVVGSFQHPLTTGALPYYLVLHTSDELYSTHSMLMKSPSSGDKLYFMPMDLRFISASSDYLSVLSSRSTALQNLLRYIGQVQVLMVTEWKASQELPGRFLQNINETLGQTGTRDIVQALYHSVATGHTFPVVREWLVDELMERGHKRWDKAVTTSLENIKRLVLQNMLPALERCSVILSRFAGIAKFQGSNDIVGFSSNQIDLLMDTVAGLNLISSKILVQVVDELTLFSSFSAWLRYEIDRLASDASPSSPDEEEPDKEGTIDHGKVLLYLQTCMTAAPLAVYLGPALPDAESVEWPHDDRLPMFTLLDSQLQKHEEGLPYSTYLPRVDFLCKILTRQATTVFSQIAEAERRNVLFGQAKDLGIQSGVALDMKMNQIDHSSFHTHIAVVPKGRSNQVHVIRIGLAIENGISTVQNVESFIMQLGDGQAKDIKFADNVTLLVLWESNGVTSLLRVNYSGTLGDNAAAFTTPYSPYVPNRPPKPTVFSNEELLERFSGYEIASGGSFIPETIEIRGHGDRKGSDEAKRIVILGSDQMQYKVFKLAARAASMVETTDEDISMS